MYIQSYTLITNKVCTGPICFKGQGLHGFSTNWDNLGLYISDLKNKGTAMIK